eukprot:scaffold30514_cov73-Cyclotella_meneghiniana.AAC.6
MVLELSDVRGAGCGGRWAVGVFMQQVTLPRSPLGSSGELDWVIETLGSESAMHSNHSLVDGESMNLWCSSFVLTLVALVGYYSYRGRSST